MTIPIPERLARRPRDHRGFVVPFFVAWLDEQGRPVAEPNGTPDFRVVEPRRMALCVNKKLCWLCGEPMGVHMGFVLGPMCTINKVISEPPSHVTCAEYAMKACPFLSRPRMRRNEVDMPANYVEAAGLPAERNPGTMALWITRSYRPFQVGKGNAGVLFEVGPFERVSWWREGRHATRAEVSVALADGYALLKGTAEKEPGGLEALDKMMPAALRTVP